MEELRKKQERVNGAGMEYKSEAGRQPTVWGLLVVGGTPKLWSNYLKLTVDFRRAQRVATSQTLLAPYLL